MKNVTQLILVLTMPKWSRRCSSWWPLSSQCEIPWLFPDCLRNVKCYSCQAGTSVVVNGAGRNSTVHGPNQNEIHVFSKVKNGDKYAANNKLF